MTAVGITENVKGDVKKFEIWYNAREEVYIIQVGPALSLWPGVRDASSLFRIADQKLLVRAGVWSLLWCFGLRGQEHCCASGHCPGPFNLS